MSQFDRPEPPIFQKVEEERLYRKQRLAAAFRLFARFGFSEGTAGHITAREERIYRPFLGKSVWYLLRSHSRL